jgi:hypothetical protein
MLLVIGGFLYAFALRQRQKTMFAAFAETIGGMNGLDPRLPVNRPP